MSWKALSSKADSIDGPGDVEAKGAVSERWRHDPATHLTEARVHEDQDCLAPSNATIRSASGHVRNHPIAGEQEGQHHQHEDLDQDDRRLGDLRGIGEMSHRRSIERQRPAREP